MNLFGWAFFTLVPVTLITILCLIVGEIYDKIEDYLIERDFKDEG